MKRHEFLRVNKLEAGYGNLQILFGIDLAVKPDEVTLIIGPNGAGKSTVLKSVFNLTNIYKGTIKFKGKDITKLPTHERIQMGISIVPQGRQVFSGLTVRENLEMGAFLTRDKDLIEARVKEVLSHFPDLKKKLRDNAYSLSGGQQQMLAMARGLMQDPQLLLLDEPSLGLSPKLMKEVFQKIREINREGTAVLMVEQNAKAASEIADRIYVLEEGGIAAKGGRKLLQSKKIQRIYLGGHAH